MSYATDNVTAAVGLVQKLSQAKNLEDAVKIQTEFMNKQLDSFNEQTKTIVEMYQSGTGPAEEPYLTGKLCRAS